LAIRHLVAALALSVSLAGAAHADEPGSDGSEDAARWVSSGRSSTKRSPTFLGNLWWRRKFHMHQAPKTVRTRHAQSAFILAYVMSGAILSQVDGEPAHIYRAGQTWQEDPRRKV
jgi:hypothetical protein